ncbi:pyridoxamine 5'-phosphate oxidase family protein [Pseudonocardia sp. KRD291]|uniref:pyridoxamine 5'-phosphate oxidase family protein n=1 Tax=Pseudonocardia sp. KRD291 TaxID=2792007 RepID=UPI001C4A5EE3|nr:pyridoxamine 5'-phosphate oxidase family protein [Pseudonocardia sp. KRD291]MBW0102285.1 pyridoxamine 5'-phosphate oxidase family protein [Pseudonocardia sp. KRD291]
MSPTDTGTLTAQDLELLRRPLHGFLTVAGGPDPAQPRPVWFEATAEGTIAMFTDPEAVKVRRLRRDPRASIVVASPVGEREHWVSVTGRTTLDDEGVHDLLARLFARYWGPDAAARSDELAGMLAADWVRVVIHPETVRRFVN